MIERAGSGTGCRIAGLAVELWDSFAERPFTGNVAGVVLDGADLDEGTMRAVAAELGAPTTGFVVAVETGPPPAVSIRYFTPVQEIDACGHVTVAVFSALAKAGRLAAVKGDGGGVEVLLHANAGRSRAVVRPAGDGAVAVEMFQRRPEHRPSPLGSDGIEALLGVPSDPRCPRNSPRRVYATSSYPTRPPKTSGDYGRISPGSPHSAARREWTRSAPSPPTRPGRPETVR